jgi:tetratricopeptide (TPR) repeat protein
VAYNGLLQKRRRMLHTRIVEALEGLSPDRLAEQVERLAHHALRGEVWHKAIAYCRQAGIKAFARSAHREAVVCFEQALGALQHLPESQETLAQAIDLRFDLRQVLFPLGELGRMLDNLRQTETLAEALGDQRRLGRVYSYMTNYYRLIGEYDRALVSGQRALAIATDLGDIVLQIMIHEYLGLLYFPLGNYAQAMEVLKYNMAALTGALVHERLSLAGLPAVVSRSYLTRCCAEVGVFTEGMAIGNDAVQIAETADHPYSRIAAYIGVGLLYLQRGALLQAAAMLERGLDLCQVANIPIWVATVASGLGYAYALAGRSAEALRLLEPLVEQPTSLLTYPLWMAHLGEAYLLAGRWDDAYTLAVRALERHRTRQERGHEAWALRLLGEVHACHEPPGGIVAATHYCQALALADELGMRPLQAHCHRGLGMLYAVTGQREQARTALSTAIAMYQSMEMTFWLPQTETALVQVDA